MNQPRETEGLPTTGQALVLFVSALVLNFFTGMAANSLALDETTILLVAPGLMLTLVLVYAVLFRVRFRESFNLKLPSGMDLLVALPLAFAFVVINDQVSSITQAVFPLPEEVLENLDQLVRAETAGDWFWKLLGLGVGAALSEELMFRGFILTGLRQRLTRRAAIVWSAMLFTMLHILPLPAFFLAGIVLAIVTVATGSIWVPVLIHLINNVAAVALVNFVDRESIADDIWLPPGILLPATMIFALTLGYFVRQILADEDDVPREQPVIEPPVTEPLRLPAPPTLDEELSSVPSEKRLVGWVVVAGATLAGLTVLLGLFSYTVYVSFPTQRHAEVIDYLSARTVRSLDEGTQARRREVETVFLALANANGEGNITGRQLFTVSLAYLDAVSDGSIEDSELDKLVATIHEVIDQSAGERL